MPVAKILSCNIPFLLQKKNNTDDYFINPESVVCGDGKLELED